MISDQAPYMAPFSEGPPGWLIDGCFVRDLDEKLKSCLVLGYAIFGANYPLACGANLMFGQRASMEQTGWRKLGRLLGWRFDREPDRELNRELWYSMIVSKPHGS
jgi:hypothetical protein